MIDSIKVFNSFLIIKMKKIKNLAYILSLTGVLSCNYNKKVDLEIIKDDIVKNNYYNTESFDSYSEDNQRLHIENKANMFFNQNINNKYQSAVLKNDYSNIANIESFSSYSEDTQAVIIDDCSGMINFR